MFIKIFDALKTIYVLSLLGGVLLFEAVCVILNPIHRLFSFIFRSIIHPKYEDIVEMHFYEDEILDIYAYGITKIKKDNDDLWTKYVDEKEFNKAVKELKRVKFFNTPSRYAKLSDLDYRDFFYDDGGVPDNTCIIILKNGREFRVYSTVFYPKKVEQYKDIIEKYYFDNENRTR